MRQTSAQPEISDAPRTLAAWTQLTALAAFFALALPFFLGKVYVADDLGEFHLPLRDFYAQQLTRGEAFDWMPSLYGGFYVAAEGQLGAYHPWHWLLYRWLPLGAGFDLELLASYPLSFAGMYWFLKRLIDRSDAALYGALAFTFCGFNLLHLVHPNAVAIIAHLPWLLATIDVALRTTIPLRRAAAVLSIGLLTASQLLLGYPQYVWFSLLAEATFVTWRLLGRTATLRDSILPLLAMATGFLVAAIQLVPTFVELSQSVRRVADSTFALTGSLHPLNVVQLLAPYLFATRVVGQNTHELGLYAGAAPTLLCLWLVCHRHRWQQRCWLVIGLLACVGASLVLASGQFGGVGRLQSMIPLVNRFRFPCRAIVLFEFTLAASAAVATAILIEDSPKQALSDDRSRHSPLMVAFAVSIGLAIAGPLLWPDYVAAPLLVWSGPVLIGAAALLINLVERGARGATVALVMFTAIDLCVYGLSYSIYDRTADLHAFVSQISRPAGGSPVRVTIDEQTAGARTGDRMLLAGLQRLDGYAGLEPIKVLDYRQQAAQQLGGAAWVLMAESDIGRGVGRWSPLAAAERVRLVTRTVGSTYLRHPDRLSTDRAVVDPPIELPESVPGSAIVVDDQPGHITIRTSAPQTQLLITTESFHEGWHARDAGGPVRIMRVNGDFLGCVVEPGQRQITLEFQPASRRVGILISACGLGLLVCLCAWSCTAAKLTISHDAWPKRSNADQRRTAGL